ADCVCRLDAREYQATVERAAANLKLAQAEALLAKQKRVRAETLFRTGVVSSGGLDIRRAEDGTAAARIGTAKADLDAARVALEYTTLRAPRSGVILAKLKEV